MNKHQVTVNGVRLTRNSANHIYSHAVVVIREAKPIKVCGWRSTRQLAEQFAQSERRIYAKFDSTAVVVVVENNTEVCS